MTGRYPRIVEAELHKRNSNIVINGEAVLLDVRLQWAAQTG